MMWFKPTGTTFGQAWMYAFKILGSIQCYFTAAQSLVCESALVCPKLETNTSNVYPDQWTHITLSGHPSFAGSYLSLETNTDVLQRDFKTYVILQQPNWGWKLCLGNCDQTYGFIGGIRDFIFIN